MDTYKHIRFIATYPKIGPDMYLTHWLLYFKPLRIFFQNRKIFKIGENSEIRPFSTINGTNKVIIGKNVIIPPYTTLSADASSNDEGFIILEDDVLLGPNVSIYSSTHNYSDIRIPIKNQGFWSKTTTLKKGCWIGINSVILPGVTVGKNSVIGANSVVAKDIPDYAVAVGCPAKVIRFLDKNNSNV